MKNILKNKFITWLIAFLIVANVASLIHFWAENFRNQRDHSPMEYLATQLKFTESQRDAYFNMASEHNESARPIRKQIKKDKEFFFDLLKSDTIIDSVRNNAALKISLSIQSLDILTFEHFKNVRALCTEEQKVKFDELIQNMVNSVNKPQKDPQASFK